MNLFSAVLITALVCCLLILGASYALPNKTDKSINSNITGNITGTVADIPLSYDENNLILEKTNSDN